MPKQSMDATIAVAAVILRQCDDVSRQPLLFGIILRMMSLRRTMLNQNTAGPSLRYRKDTTDLLDRLTRSEERRVGKEWASTCSSRVSPYQLTKTYCSSLPTSHN